MIKMRFFTRMFRNKSAGVENSAKLSTDRKARSCVDNRSARWGESGNVFFTLFGAVAVVGVLGAGVMSTMRGPLSTMVEVNRMEEAKAEMRLGARLIVAKSTDVDGDDYVEGVDPAGSSPDTVIPNSVSAEKNDPWGTAYRYCAWNHGFNAGEEVAYDDVLAGGTDPNEMAIVLISAGPDRTFQTECKADPLYVVSLGGTTQADRFGGTHGAGDDLMEALSYADAVSASGGLWELNVADKATISKDLAVTGGADFAGQVRFDGADPLSFASNISNGLVIPNQAALLDTDCDGDDGANQGLVRINETTSPDTLELCDNDGTSSWEPVNEAYHEWVDDGSDNISHDGGNVSTTQNLTVGGTSTLGVLGAGATTVTTLHATGATDLDTTLNVDGTSTLAGVNAQATTVTTLHATGATDLDTTLDVDGKTTINDDLDVSGNTELGDALTDTVTIAGITTIGDTLDVTGATTVTTLHATGAVDLDTTLDVQGDVLLGDTDTDTVTIAGITTIGDTLDVTGTITGSAGAVLSDGIKLGDAGSCTGTAEGTIHYDGTRIEYCNGSAWKGMAVDKLRDIDNVNISADPTDKFLISWNNTSKKWDAVDPTTLEVADSDTSDEALKLEDDDNDTKIEVDTAGDGSDNTIVFTNNSSESMIIDADGKVGIGLSDPDSNLHIAGSGGGAIATLRVEDPYTTAGAGFPQIILRDRGGVDVDKEMFSIRSYDSGSFSIGLLNDLETIYSEYFTVKADGNIGIGASPNVSSLLDVTSTTKGFLPPRLTTVQRNAVGTPVIGLQVYNTDDRELQCFDGTVWGSCAQTLGTGGGGELDDLGCADGQIVAWNSGTGTWECADDNTGAGSNLVSFSGLQEVQSIATSGALDWESFSIGGESYLAVANDGNGSTHNINSKIYKWDGSAFAEVQSIATNGGRDWESFSIAGESYLAVANNYNDSTQNINSKIYKWNGSAFAEVQSIATNGAYGWESFSIAGESYLAVANHYNGSTYNINSKIYKWNGSAFAEVQSIATNGAYGWESFSISGESYLVVANYMNGSTNIDSKIYKWNGSAFAEVQSIATNGALDWESFSIGGESYLAVANSYNGSTYSVNSKIYKWNGSAFAEVQSIVTDGAADWESFSIGGESYLVVANRYNGSTYNIDSKIYKWDGSAFAEVFSITTNGAADWESFSIGGESYLALANWRNGSNYNINSKIYRISVSVSDTLSGLSCTDGQITKWDDGGSTWVCADDPSVGGGDNLGNHIATKDLAMGNFDVDSTSRVGFTGVAGDAPISASDTLGGLTCTDGQVAAWDNTGTTWVCADGGSGGGGGSQSVFLEDWPDAIMCTQNGYRRAFVFEAGHTANGVYYSNNTDPDQPNNAHFQFNPTTRVQMLADQTHATGSDCNAKSIDTIISEGNAIYFGGGGSSGGGSSIWVNVSNIFDGEAAPVILDGNGVASVTKISLGRVRVAFSTPQADANYAAICTAHRDDTSDGFITTNSKTVNGFDVILQNYTSTRYDFSFQCMIPGSGGGGSDTLSALSCTSGQVAAWDGTAWACADDLIGTGYSSDVITGAETYLADNEVTGDADNAADGSSGNYWRGGGADASSHWWSVDFGAGNDKTITKYVIDTGYIDNARVSNIYFEGSATGAWGGEETLINTWASPGLSDSSVGNTREVTNSTAYRYYRLRHSYSPAGHAAWEEIHMYEAAAASGSADNLGDHTATEALDMATFDIMNAGSIELESVTGADLPTGGSGAWATSGSDVYRASGNVGIGTASPVYGLSIEGAATQGIQVKSTSGTQHSAVYLEANARLWSLANRADLSGGFSIVDETASVHRLTILTNGNVGIGTSGPSYKLHVAGTAYATGAAGSLSDRRHKKNIVSMDDTALDTIMRLRPVTFEWKDALDSGMAGTQMGFIAQEVEKVLPTMVLTQPNEEKTKGLKSTELLPVLAKAIQELSDKTDVQKSRLDAAGVPGGYPYGLPVPLWLAILIAAQGAAILALGFGVIVLLGRKK